MQEFCRGSFAQSLPVQDNSPNWEAYRLNLLRMKRLSSQSTHWRATTGYEVYGVDYTDYVRGKTSSVDILSIVILGTCKDVEYVNIRGHAATNTKASFWQRSGKYMLHMDHSFVNCPYKSTAGAVYSENDFGFYCEGDGMMNVNFRGTKTEDSTTQWWFGGYL